MNYRWSTWPAAGQQLSRLQETCPKWRNRPRLRPTRSAHLLHRLLGKSFSPGCNEIIPFNPYTCQMGHLLRVWKIFAGTRDRKKKTIRRRRRPTNKGGENVDLINIYGRRGKNVTKKFKLYSTRLYESARGRKKTGCDGWRHRQGWCCVAASPRSKWTRRDRLIVRKGQRKS
jgi:hypothetical protein